VGENLGPNLRPPEVQRKVTQVSVNKRQRGPRGKASHETSNGSGRSSTSTTEVLGAAKGQGRHHTKSSRSRARRKTLRENIGLLRR